MFLKLVQIYEKTSTDGAEYLEYLYVDREHNYFSQIVLTQFDAQSWGLNVENGDCLVVTTMRPGHGKISPVTGNWVENLMCTDIRRNVGRPGHIKDKRN
jgi:hypothetical protein